MTEAIQDEHSVAVWLDTATKELIRVRRHPYDANLIEIRVDSGVDKFTLKLIRRIKTDEGKPAFVRKRATRGHDRPFVGHKKYFASFLVRCTYLGGE